MKYKDDITKSKGRLRTLADWLVEALGRSGLGFSINQISMLLNSPSNEDKKKAVRQFQQLMFAHNDETVKYVINQNINANGKVTTVSLLMGQIFKRNVRKEVVRDGFRRVGKEEQQRLGRTKRSLAQKQKTRSKIFGYNSQGKREVAETIVIIVRNNPRVRLRSKKTGKFLKNPREEK